MRSNMISEGIVATASKITQRAGNVNLLRHVLVAKVALKVGRAQETFSAWLASVLEWQIHVHPHVVA